MSYRGLSGTSAEEAINLLQASTEKLLQTLLDEMKGLREDMKKHVGSSPQVKDSISTSTGKLPVPTTEGKPVELCDNCKYAKAKGFWKAGDEEACLASRKP